MATADYKVCKHFHILALKQSFVKTINRMLYTNFYQNQPSFEEDITKTFWLTFFSDMVYIHMFIMRCVIVLCQYQPPKIKKASAPSNNSYGGGYDDEGTMHSRTSGSYSNPSSMFILPVM